ncbi:MAG: TatD family hydrolase [Desulfuromonadales bacterium]|nr:TatD family hydrolase [Desulfuromonadales bacterium]
MVASGVMSKPVYFDTHIHLDALGDEPMIQREVRLARAAGVGAFLVPGVHPRDWPRLLQTVGHVPEALAAPGVHPLAAADWNTGVADKLTALLATPAVVAVGEVGLDGVIQGVSPAQQEKAFRHQIRLAVEAGLPLLIHCRKATARLLDILHQEEAQKVGGIFHGFSGSRETALQAVKLHFAIGFGGPLTYPEARRGPEVLSALPEEWIVLETDAPDLSPHPHRQEENRPSYLPLIAERVAQLRGWTLAQTAAITTANAKRILNLVQEEEGKPYFRRKGWT